MMITVENIGFAYGNHETVFDHFSFSVARGETLAVIGPSGGGKTTLLHLLAGLRLPRAGRVTIDGKPLDRPRPGNGLVLQDHGLLPWSTVRDNVALGLKIRRFYGPDGRHSPNNFTIDPDQADQQVACWLNRLDIADLADKYPAQLSRGQRQRTAIARTMTLEPDVLLMDEPFSALDAPTSENLQDLVSGLAGESNLTTVFVTHHIAEAVRMGRRILVVRRGINRHPHIVITEGGGEISRQDAAVFNHQCDNIRGLLGKLP
jgi:ABC-type nitrate/sulfonate/bicarbonate transport system ATPase subunit